MSNNEFFKSNIDITPKKDIVFKKIFGSKGNEGILKDFLESILDLKINSLMLDVGAELLPDFSDGKLSRVDVRATLSDGSEVNVEMQSDIKGYSEKRCFQYWSRIYSNAIKEGAKYTDLRKTICVWILDGSFYNEFEDFHSKWEMVNKKHDVVNRFNEIEFHVLELKKFRESAIIKPSRKEFWLGFIDHSNEELIKLACNNNDKVKEARAQLEKIRADKELMERIRLEELYEWDINTGLERARNEGEAAGFEKGEAAGFEKGETAGFEKGEAAGKTKRNREIVLKLLEMNLPIEQIMEATGLSSDEIEKIKKGK